MTTIICATRGGSGSRAVRERAIEYARQRGAQLIFLFVIDANSLEGVGEKLRLAVHDELAWFGLALLRIAQQRADAANLKSEIVIREGTVRDEICRFIGERSADLLLVGAPRGKTTAVFGYDKVEQFAAEVERTTGVPVEIVRPHQVSGAEEGEPASPPPATVSEDHQAGGE
jgi:nucleotide-binding universal stress UspA family protein